MDLEELRVTIAEARKEFLEGKYTLTDEKLSLVHITQILTYADLKVEDYMEVLKGGMIEKLKKLEDCDELLSQGIAKSIKGGCVPKNSLVIEAARRLGHDLGVIRKDPRNEALLDLSYALDSLKIPNELKIIDGELKLLVKGQKVYPVIVGIVQPEKAYGRTGEDLAKLRLYVPRFLSGSLGRKLLPIIIDLGLAEALKNIPIIYLPLGILSILAYYKKSLPAISIYTPVYKKIEHLFSG